jgi:APA family basic amino acid/polyamine antiporter
VKQQASAPQKISLLTAIVVGMNCMIGAGIFALPIDLAKGAGPASIITMLIVVVAVWFMAMSIAQVATVIPTEGSFYTYTKSWGGHTLGLIAAGSYIMGLMIALGGIMGHIAGENLATYTSTVSPWTLGLLILVFLIILNILGIIVSQAVQYTIIGLTLLAMISITVICFLQADFHNLIPFAPHGVWSIFQVVPLCIFGLFGFETTASLFPILKNPEKNLPKALAYSISIVGLLYILFILSIMLVIPYNAFITTSTSRSLPLILSKTLSFGSWILPIIGVAIITAICGVIHSMMWGSSALLFSLLKQIKNHKIKHLIKTNKITQRTCVLIVGSITLAWYFPKLGALTFSFVSLGIVFAYLLAIIALLFTPYRKNPITIIGFLSTLGIFGIALAKVIIALF